MSSRTARFLLLITEVFIHLVAVIEVIADDSMNVGELQRWKAFVDLFSAIPLLILIDHGFKADTRTGDPNRSVLRQGHNLENGNAGSGDSDSTAAYVQ